MGALDRIVRYTLGIVFVFSGMVKLIDPTGTAIKMKEYFEIFSSDFSPLFHHLLPFVMPLAILICLLEVMLGWAMILNYKGQKALGAISILLLYFGFLTFYSAYYNKVTDCGCFGDAIPLTPWQSFYKDLILLVLVIYLFFRKKMFEGSQTNIFKHIAIFILLFFNSGIAYYGIEHLPIVDFRAYKIGANIGQSMQASGEYQYEYLMERNEKEYLMESYPSDTTYHFKEMILLNPEVSPKITDFNVWNDEGDFTEQILKGKKLLILISNYSKTKLSSYQLISDVIKRLPSEIEPVILTAGAEGKIDALRHEYQITAPIYFCDETVLKAMIRSNPGLMLLNNGTILGKWHANDIPTAENIEGAF